MKGKIWCFIILFGGIAMMGGCRSKTDISGNYTFKTECMGTEMDGSVTVKAWGNGRNRADAIEQARKNAVNDVIFKGIMEGTGGCNFRPVVGEVNARMKYESYFDAFFRDRGEFQNYVSTEDEKFSDRFRRDPRMSRHGNTYGVILRVKRSELREKFLSDGILKQQ
ncbi:MAG: hypothetical protein LBE56_07050 [Tannerella sp.]|nr:hypothetical protein [Tannerella sp.]